MSIYLVVIASVPIGIVVRATFSNRIPACTPVITIGVGSVGARALAAFVRHV